MKKKIAVGGILLVLVIVFALGGLYYFWVRRPLPKLDGKITIPGLKAEVRVIRDPWGVPHIYAQNEHDLFMTQGFVQAQDRLWQLEQNRRFASGRLSEILGAETEDLDRLLRTWGYMRAAEKELAASSDQDKAVLEAFASGINAYIERAGDRLPVEFRLLGIKPEPWRPVDSVAWAKVIAMNGSKNWQEELVRVVLVKTLGLEKATQLLSLISADIPPIVSSLSDVKAMDRFIADTNAPLPIPLGGASNNWVVSGNKSNTGLPLLANDTHLPINIPSLWYETHLSGAGFDVIGLSLAGVPMVVIGHNSYLAWGVTFAYVDNQDIFFEKMGTRTRGQYLYRGEWLDAERIVEEIKVKNRDKPTTHEVWITRHGPLINRQVKSLRPLRLGHSLALKWSGWEPGGMIAGMRRLNLAKNWEEFKTAALDWAEPPLNMVYADREGHIGYVLAGRVPFRERDFAQGPFPGWAGQYEWIDYLTPEQKPVMLDPKKGFIQTANNRIVGDDYTYYIGVDFAPGYRAERIGEVLSEKDKFSVQDFMKLQNDLKCLPAADWVRIVSEAKITDAKAQAMIDELVAWDLEMKPESKGASVYAILMERLLENTFRDDMGTWADLFFGKGLVIVSPLTRFLGHSPVVLRNLVDHPNSIWWDDSKTPEKEDFNNILEKSLVETADLLEQFEKSGHGPEWGKLHELTVKHPMGRVRPLDRIFNLGPFPGSGYQFTVMQSTSMPGPDFKYDGWTASNRHIYDVADWDGSYGLLVPGQSGQYGSAHYSDQMNLWLEGRYHPLLFSKKMVEAQAANTLVLTPAP